MLNSPKKGKERPGFRYVLNPNQYLTLKEKNANIAVQLITEGDDDALKYGRLLGVAFSPKTVQPVSYTHLRAHET